MTEAGFKIEQQGDSYVADYPAIAHYLVIEKEGSQHRITMWNPYRDSFVYSVSFNHIHPPVVRTLISILLGLDNLADLEENDVVATQITA